MFETRTIEATPSSINDVPIRHSPDTLALHTREEIAEKCAWMCELLRQQIALWCEPQAPKRETLLVPIASEEEMHAAEALATRLEELKRNALTAAAHALRIQYSDILQNIDPPSDALHYYRQILDWYPAFLPLGAIGIPARSDGE